MNKQLTDIFPKTKELVERNKAIKELKRQLFATDYKAIKFAEGWLTIEEYAPIKDERQKIRNKINELEAKKNVQD